MSLFTKDSNTLTGRQKTTNKYSISGLFVWIAVLFLFPVIGQTLDITSIISGTIFIAGAWSAGILILSGVESINSLKGIVKDGIAILLGSIALYWVFYLFSEGFNQLIFYAVTLLLLISVVILKRGVLLCFDLSSLIAIIVVIAYYTIIHDSADLALSLADEPVHFANYPWDSIFFTAIVASMKHGSLQSVWEAGTPIAYEIGSFFAPSGFSAATNISSHISLWGCWMPFYKIVGMLSISEFVLIIGPGRYSLWSKSLIVFLFFFLVPLHPEYLLKLEIEKFVWLGSGHIIPGGNTPSTMGFAWISIIGIIVFYKNAFKYNLYSSVLLIVLISTLILVKVPLFIPFTVFLGVIALFQLIKRNYAFFFICFFSFILSVILYIFNYHEAGMQEVSLSFGYLPLAYASLAELNGFLAGFAVIFAVFLIWGGIKYVGLFLLVKCNNPRLNYNNLIVLSTLISWLASFLMALSFKILYLDENGATIFDGTQDVEQFIKSASGLLGVITIAGFMFLFYGNVPKRLRQTSMALCIVWCALTFISTYSRTLELKPDDIKWYSEVKEELQTIKPKLAAINLSDTYSGQLLVAADLGKFWVTTRRRESGYNVSNVNSWRWKVMDQCLSSDSTISIQGYRALLVNHVDAIIASPETIEQLKLFAKYNKLELPAGFKWTYPLPGNTR